MNNRLESLRVFVVAADSENFRAAAQRLAVSPQVVTRTIQDLEEALGERLFHRNTRGVQLSDHGRELVAQARAAVDAVDQLFQGGQRAREQDLAGTVRVTSSTALGRHHVLRALAACQRQHPALHIDLRLSDAIADLVDQQIDVGVRIGLMRDSRLVARPAGPVRLDVVATPELLARVGRPAHIEDLTQMPTTALMDPHTGKPWPWLFKGSRHVAPPRPAFVTDDADAELAAICQGLGFGQVPDFLARPHVDQGTLVRVLQREQAPAWTLYVYRPQRSPLPARTRLVFDALVQELGALTKGR
jgi:DNA-binding transcriptional LysR family regulator